MEIGTVFNTRWDTQCSVCGVKKYKGESVRYISKGKVACIGCVGAPVATEPVAATPATPAPSGAMQALATELAPMIEGMITARTTGNVDRDEVADILTELLDKRPPMEIRVNDGPTVAMPDLAHAKLAKVVKLVASRTDSHLYDGKDGGPGSGKSYMVEQAAQLLGMRYMNITLGPATSEAALFGFMNAAGTYTSTQFRNFVEFGGVCTIEEIGLAHDAVIATMNAGLANSHFSFPDGMVKRHEDFVLITIDQTNLRTMDDRFARRPMDISFVDRLVFMPIDYDSTVERTVALSKANVELHSAVNAWVDWVGNARTLIKSTGGNIFPTPRASFLGAKLLNNGFKVAEVAEMVVWKSILDDDTKARVLEAYPLPVLGL